MWDTILNIFTGGLWQLGKSTVGGVTGATSAITDTTHTIQAVWVMLSDYRMWRSLGWLLLGVILMFMGFVIWNRKAIGSAITTVAAVK